MAAEAKTKKTGASVDAFLSAIGNDDKEKDARAILSLMQKVTREKPAMWGPSIVGFGEFLYRSTSGREGTWPLIGFSPRSQNLTLYFMGGFEKLAPLMKKLGKHTSSSSCLYVRRLSDLDLGILEKIIAQGHVEAQALDRSKDAKPSTKKTKSAKAKAATKPAAKPKAKAKSRSTATRSRRA